MKGSLSIKHVLPAVWVRIRTFVRVNRFEISEVQKRAGAQSVSGVGTVAGWEKEELANEGTGAQSLPRHDVRAGPVR
jgi:hypothetical protein